MTKAVQCNGDDASVLFLPDGREARLRPIRSDDDQALMRFHRQLSEQSIRYRYFYPHTDLQASEVVHLTAVDGRDRVALVVAVGDDLVAVGRYDRLAMSTKAEVAFVVADAFQHIGIAPLLLRRLAARARGAGITEFGADVLIENAAMLSVFRDAGFPMTSSCAWGTTSLTMTIASAAGEHLVA